MDDIQLPRHVIDRLEHRWANRLQQDAKAWSGEKASAVRYAMCSPTVRETSLSPSNVLAVLRMRLGSNRPKTSKAMDDPYDLVLGMFALAIAAVMLVAGELYL